MASSSYLPPDASQQYLYASIANVSNFVSVKLSGNDNYHLWKAQILCLMKSHNMAGLVDEKFGDLGASSVEIKVQYENLLKGWIFGSISEGLLGTVVDLGSAKEVWDKLKSFYDPTMISQQVAKVEDAIPTETKANEIELVSAETKTQPEDKDVTITESKSKTNIDVVSKEKEVETKDQVVVSTKPEGLDVASTGIIMKYNEKVPVKDKNKRNKELRRAIVEEDMKTAVDMTSKEKVDMTEAIDSDGNTVLHIAVGIGFNKFVEKMLSSMEENHLTKVRNQYRSTPLHIAAVVGNTNAAELLVKKNKTLLEIKDRKGDTPLNKAYENMHLDTIEYLLKAANDDGKTNKKAFPNMEDSLPDVATGVNILVNAISAKQYDLATTLVKEYPNFVVENDNALLAIARTFPSELDFGKALFYPSFDHISKSIVENTQMWLFSALAVILVPFILIVSCFDETSDEEYMEYVILLFLAPFIWIFFLIKVLILMIYFPFSVVYFLFWKVAARVVAPIKHIEKRKTEPVEAKKLLALVCDEIDKFESPMDTHPRYYTRPVLEAACQNCIEVVDEILSTSPEAIRYKDKNGYDIIQLAVIHRSEKIYNLIYKIGEQKSIYRTIEDSSMNNMLHLAGRLAPARKLNRITGAALQLQRELQWRKEVEKLVFPANITKENIFMETPDMVFTKEHQNLVREGENWMKTVAESSSITAALITTIVFAAAITVPGGSNQENGIPLFKRKAAFTVFAIADAISLFTSTTSLLVFLSILTARFAEQDFLVSLPRRLIIALCTLLVSTTAMMVAFGTTLFLVLGGHKPWMLAPICVAAFFPFASFCIFQIPLIVDLFRSTFIQIFGKEVKSSHNTRFNPKEVAFWQVK